MASTTVFPVNMGVPPVGFHFTGLNAFSIRWVVPSITQKIQKKIYKI